MNATIQILHQYINRERISSLFHVFFFKLLALIYTVTTISSVIQLFECFKRLIPFIILYVKNA